MRKESHYVVVLHYRTLIENRLFYCYLMTKIQIYLLLLFIRIPTHTHTATATAALDNGNIQLRSLGLLIDKVSLRRRTLPQNHFF